MDSKSKLNYMINRNELEKIEMSLILFLYRDKDKDMENLLGSTPNYLKN